MVGDGLPYLEVNYPLEFLPQDFYQSYPTVAVIYLPQGKVRLSRALSWLVAISESVMGQDHDPLLVSCLQVPLLCCHCKSPWRFSAHIHNIPTNLWWWRRKTTHSISSPWGTQLFKKNSYECVIINNQKRTWRQEEIIDRELIEDARISTKHIHIIWLCEGDESHQI